MDSKYLKQVMNLVREIYPTAIWKETNLYNLTYGSTFSPHLRNLIIQTKADLKKMRVDLYIKGQVALEVHGEQHERPIKFSNEILNPEEELSHRKALDEIKHRALTEAGIPFVVIWYKELKDGSLTKELLRNKIYDAQIQANKVPKQKRTKVKPPKFRTLTESFEARTNRLEKARLLRKNLYSRNKARKKCFTQKNITKRSQ